MNDKIMQNLERIFKDLFGEIKDFSIESQRKDFKEWDSIKHLEIIFSIEKKLKVKFNTFEIISIKSIKDIYMILKEKNVDL